MVTLNCFQCGKALGLQHELGRREECLHCHADIHCCRNCKFYDPKAYNECREPSAEPVQVKDRANFCDYFALGTGVGGQSKSAEDLRRAAENLFKKK